MYCWRCGEFNDDAKNKCVKCDAELRAVDIACPAESLSTLIPYKNSNALIAYYLGVFSLIPFFGMILGIVALILGLQGLAFYKQHPETKGLVHAWVGIIMGSVFGIGQILAGIGFWIACFVWPEML
jgi:hypothetical protein